MRHLLFVSHRAYPFGGGEEDLYDKAQIALNAGWEVSWLSHATGFGRVFTESDHTNKMQGINIIYEPYTTEEDEKNLLISLRPTVILAIGRMIPLLKRFNAIPWIAVYHFWTGILDMGNGNGNIDILGNAQKRVHSEYYDVLKTASATVVVSPFMQRVMLSVSMPVIRVITPSPSFRSISKAPYIPELRKWALFINAHTLKGAKLLPYLIRKYPDIPVRMIITEKDSDSTLPIDILQAMCERNNGAPVEILTRTTRPSDLYNTARIVICCSVVDETFGRVATEAMASGVPAILSKRGNLEYLGGASAFYVNPDQPENAATMVGTLFTDFNQLNSLSKYGIQQSKQVSEEIVESQFLALLHDVTHPPPKHRIMFYCPWSDQGLGTQVKAYVSCLDSVGIETAIFSFRPYLEVENPCISTQSDPFSWVHPRVYYSSGNREKVTDLEFISALNAFKPSSVVIPETCWYRVFQIADLCAILKIPCGAIPNIELVRNSELNRHASFSVILGNNYQCVNKLLEAGMNAKHIGFGLPTPIHVGTGTSPERNLQFLLIGGYNVDGRKQGPKIVRAFQRAFLGIQAYNAPTLIVTSQSEQSSKLTKDIIDRNSKNITYIVENQTMNDITKLLSESDVCLLPSKHEGLGMGFYEAMNAGCPIITSDCPPHNEIVSHEVNGWLLPGVYVHMKENDDAIVQSFDFDEEALVKLFVDLHDNASKVRSFRTKVVEHVSAQFNKQTFARKLVIALEGCIEESAPAEAITRPRVEEDEKYIEDMHKNSFITEESYEPYANPSISLVKHAPSVPEMNYVPPEVYIKPSYPLKNRFRMYGGIGLGGRRRR